MFKVGIGQDSHRFSEDKNKPLILGGVEFSGGNGFKSNSDGDVIIHALCNALEQAIGSGKSLASYSDEMCENGITESSEYLKKAMEHVGRKGYEINNIGINVEAQRPKIDPMANSIKQKLAEIIKVDKNLIGITATTGEDLTVFGRGEGAQAFVIVSLTKKQ